MYMVYWRDPMRKRHHNLVKARTYDEAYDFAQKSLEKGSVITAIYKAPWVPEKENYINFRNKG